MASTRLKLHGLKSRLEGKKKKTAESDIEAEDGKKKKLQGEEREEGGRE